MSSRDVLFMHCLGTAEQLPTIKRAELFRALADYSGDDKQAADLVALATSLELADHRCREFAFVFAQGVGGVK